MPTSSTPRELTIEPELTDEEITKRFYSDVHRIAEALDAITAVALAFAAKDPYMDRQLRGALQ